MDADPELDPAACRHGDVPLHHRSLHLCPTAQRVDHAGELHQQSVTGGLDDAALVRGYLRVDQLPPKCLEAREGPFLVGADQPAVPRDVRGENGGQPAFDRC
jgi:hypothetical protein